MVSGTVQTVLFRSNDANFAVIDLLTEAGAKVRARGRLAGLLPGETARLVGGYVVDPRFGRTFLADEVRADAPTSAEGVAMMLAGLGAKGIGARTAQKVVAALGPNALQRLRDEPECLAEVPGLGATRAAALRQALAGHGANAQTEAALHALGLGPALVARCAERWPQDAATRLRRDPYVGIGQVRGYGFGHADALARRLGHRNDAPERLGAGARAALQALIQDGHTAPPEAAVLARTERLLSVEPAAAVAGLEALLGRGLALRLQVAQEPETRCALAEALIAERDLAIGLLALGMAAPPPAASPTSGTGMATGPGETHSAEAERIELAAATLGVVLAKEQRQAIAAALRGGFQVVTGGPGTGKTTLVRGILAALGDAGRVLLAAPTGRAARRLGEATGLPASTLHRMLGYDPRTQRFEHDARNPLAADLVIVDEASMLDVVLAAALVCALPPHCALVLIGDVDQLPSVGAGAVLQDVIAAEVGTLTRLSRVFRQGERSAIVDAAFAILQGEMPEGCRDPSGDFFLLLRDTGAEVARTVVEVAARRLPQRLGLDLRRDIAVLVPMHRGPCGTRALNLGLAAAMIGSDLEPDAASGRPTDLFDFDSAATSQQAPNDERRPLQAGDKVLQMRNHPELDLFNGDVGVVVGRNARGLLVRFAEREVCVEGEAQADLELAWAMTVHKAQGSEVPAVVIGLDDSHHLLLDRHLLYTAVTRARRLAVVVSTRSALQRALSLSAPRGRATLLQALLRGQDVSVVEGRARP